MSTQVQWRRGTNSEIAAFTGADGEITVNTTNYTLSVHDGSTAGGFALVSTTANQTLTNKTLSGNTTISGNLIPSANLAYNLGSSDFRFKDLWLSGNTVYIANSKIEANASSLIFTNPSGGQFVLSSASNASTDIALGGDSGSGSVPGGGTLVVNGTSNQITTSVSSNTITVSLAQNITAPGNFTVVGNLTVQGNTTTIGSNNLTVVDSIIDLHTYANLNAHTVDDGRDIGVRFHYYKGSDDHAFLGWENSTQTLIYLQRSDEADSNIAGTFGNVQFGSLLLANTTIASSTTSGALQVRGGVGVLGNIYVGGSGGDAIVATGNIIPSSNIAATNNIGSDTAWWNNFYGVATQARYADLAENYQADDNYVPGTVLSFGGVHEVTVSSVSHDTAVAGVVSTNPAHLMNSALNGNNVVPVALQGRVPCQVQGPVAKGTILVTSNIPGVAMAMDPIQYQPGCIVGKSLGIIEDSSIETIEIVVGRF